jgi:hypothetical protein
MKDVDNFSGQRVIITRTVVLTTLLFLAWRGFEGILPGQFHDPAIFRLDFDFAYWLLKLSGISNAIVAGGAVGTGFNIALLAVGVLLCIFPRKRVLAALYALLYLLSAIVFNIYIGHGTNYQAGFAVILIAFCAGTDDDFSLWWRTMRYYSCFIYTVCFCWKVAHGAFFNWDHGIASMENNLAEYLTHYPDTAMSHIYYWFLQHPFLVNFGDKIVFLAEGVFAIGFFTRRYDRWLIASACFIFISIYLFADVFFIELLFALVFTLLSVKDWEKLSRFFGRKSAALA